MWDLLAALGLALVLEGVLYALFPAAMRRFMAEALKQPDSAIRIGALINAVHWRRNCMVGAIVNLTAQFCQAQGGHGRYVMLVCVIVLMPDPDTERTP